MRKRARSILTGLLVLCCVVAGLVPVVHVQADSSISAGRNIVVMENAALKRTAYPLAVSIQTSAPVESPSSGPWQTAWAWIQTATRSTGAWIQKTTRSTGAWIQKTTRSTGAWIQKTTRSTGAWIQKTTRSTGAWIQKTTRSTGAWIQKTTRSTGAFIASVYMSIRDFFVSGQALKVLQTATQAITDFAVRLFLPLSVLVVPILERTVPGLSVTPELVAVWMFWIIVVLALLILLSLIHISE